MASTVRRFVAAGAAAALAAGLAVSAPAGADPVTPPLYSDCASVTGNLVTNCGFETGDATGWTLTPASSDSLVGFNSNSGYSGSSGVAFEAFGQQDDQLSQTIGATVPGQTYVLGYWLVDFFGHQHSHFAVTVSNVQGGSQTFDEQTDVASDEWTYFQDTFVAGSGDPVLTFSGRAPSGAFVLDDVAVSSGPFSQAITFTSTPPSNAIIGGTYTVTATGGSSGNPIIFITDPRAKGCTVTQRGDVTFTAAATCLIDASQDGNTTVFTVAPTAQLKIVVHKIAQAVHFTSTPPAHALVNTPYTAVATGGLSGNSVQYSVSPASAAVCTVASDGTVMFNAVGRCTIVAAQAGNASYAAGRSTQVVVVHAH